jgi:hypothetical protein
MIGVCHCAQKFLPRLALNYDPPDFYLPSAEDYRLVSLCLTSLIIFLAGFLLVYGLMLRVPSRFCVQVIHYMLSYIFSKSVNLSFLLSQLSSTEQQNSYSPKHVMAQP